MKSAVVALLFLGMIAVACGVAVVAPAYSYGYYGYPAYSTYHAAPIVSSYGYRTYGAYPYYGGYASAYGYPYGGYLLKK